MSSTRIHNHFLIVALKSSHLTAHIEAHFKFSFFFWLDFVATVSLIFDLPKLLDLLGFLLLLDPSSSMVDVKFGKPINNNTQNPISTIMTSFRLIRLIRIIKLYNYVSKSNAASEEAKLREQQKLSANA